MSLANALAAATSGLLQINSAFSVMSQNVANASTPDYAVESATATSVTSDGIGMGVRTGVTVRAIDVSAQGDVFAQDGVVAGLQTRQGALAAVDAVQGTPGGTTNLASLVGALNDAFTTLEGSPDNQTQQAAVVNAAQSLAKQINALSATYEQGRQGAENAIVTDVSTLNSTLATIGSLSDQIVTLKAQGQSTADLENQRDQSMQTLAQLTGVKFLAQPNGDVLVLTPSGLQLPTHFTTPPITTTGVTVGPSTSYPNDGIPGIMLGGTDITQQLQGGQIGANLTLRDQTFPQYQGELDEFAQTLTTRFAAQGLTLFTDANGNVPASGGTPTQAGYLGYASTIQVNPAVLASPSLVRDGTNAITGSATGATDFTPNPSGGPVGFTDLITRVLSYTFGANVRDNVAQPAPAITGLGPTGSLSAPYPTPADLADFAASVVSAESSDSAQASGDVTAQTAVQTALRNTLNQTSAVSIDAAMSKLVQLENAYGANAKVVSSVQTMFSDLLQMVS